MKLAIPLVLLAAAGVAPRHGCGEDQMAHDPCEAKVCGAACTVCAPDDSGCVETAVLKACDPSGQCVVATSGLCGAPAPVAGTCDGKRCRDACDLAPACALADPPCALPTVAGACRNDGVCTTSAFLCPEVPIAPPSGGESGGVTIGSGGQVLGPEYRIDPAP